MPHSAEEFCRLSRYIRIGTSPKDLVEDQELPGLLLSGIRNRAPRLELIYAMLIEGVAGSLWSVSWDWAIRGQEAPLSLLTSPEDTWPKIHTGNRCAAFWKDSNHPVRDHQRTPASVILLLFNVKPILVAAPR